MERHSGHNEATHDPRYHMVGVAFLGALVLSMSAYGQRVTTQASGAETRPTITDAELDEFESRLKYSEAAIAPYVVFQLIQERGRDRVEALLREAQTRRPYAARLWANQWQMIFAGDSIVDRTLAGEARKAHFRKVLEYLQESYDATTRALQQARDKGNADAAEERDSARTPDSRATYDAIQIAVKNMSSPPRTDRDVYDWLAENPGKLGGYTLPAYETWLHDVRRPWTADLPGAITWLQQSLALAAFEAGETALANKHATELLKNNTDAKSWNYGNIIHNANQILGRMALREGQVAEAKRYLLKAGRTPGSPQLNSFGPRFCLARELLEKGEKTVVLEYLDLVGTFWANPEKGHARSAEEHATKLLQWKKEIMEGGIPEDGPWR